jgi:pSer/pThr/pTyr-binding forkhead associated (FHA) protein
MIVCPNCNHANPDGAVQCEACYTPLPTSIPCPSCGTAVQADASFCGQCGYNLKSMSASMSSTPESSLPNSEEFPAIVPDPLVQPDPIILPTEAAPSPAAPPKPQVFATQLQQSNARLLNLQTSTIIEIPPGLIVIHIGKPNDQIPPDIDVSGFPNSEVVSRIHADIRVEGDAYYIEDVGSSNGTYINNSPLPMGNRHRLRPGDRISLGKGDKVSFLFQI